MLDSFVGISEDEKQSLINAIPEITVLIAGADGVIDTEEVAWAKKLTGIRSYTNPESLQEYYGFVGDEFEDKLNALINELPKDVNERNSILKGRLEKLNPILAKMDNENAYGLYNSFISFAEHVAKSSGGFLRMWAISGEEKEWVNLPMINKIEKEEEEA